MYFFHPFIQMKKERKTKQKLQRNLAKINLTFKETGER